MASQQIESIPKWSQNDFEHNKLRSTNTESYNQTQHSVENVSALNIVWTLQSGWLQIY